MTRRRHLQRTHEARRRQKRGQGGFNPAGMIRLAGFGAAIIVALGAYVGFHRQGETIYDGRWGALERLVTPLFFGINALELIVIALVGFIGWRIWLRMQAKR